MPVSQQNRGTIPRDEQHDWLLQSNFQKQLEDAYNDSLNTELRHLQ